MQTVECLGESAGGEGTKVFDEIWIGPSNVCVVYRHVELSAIQRLYELIQWPDPVADLAVLNVQAANPASRDPDSP